MWWCSTMLNSSVLSVEDSTYEPICRLREKCLLHERALGLWTASFDVVLILPRGKIRNTLQESPSESGKLYNANYKKIIIFCQLFWINSLSESVDLIRIGDVSFVPSSRSLFKNSLFPLFVQRLLKYLLSIALMLCFGEMQNSINPSICRKNK